MAKGLKIGRRNIKPRFFVFVTIIGICIYWLFGLSSSRPTEYASVEYGSITTENKSHALIVRNEQIHTAPIYGKVLFHVDENQMVKNGDVLATIYKSNYQEEVVYQLYNVQEKIINYQEQNIIDKINDKDLDKVQEDINNIIYDIQENIRDTNMKQMDKKERNVRLLLEQRKEIIDKKGNSDEYLKNLYDEQNKLTEQIKDWKLDIVSPASGLVSFYIDGLEQILNFDSLDEITTESYQELLQYQAPSKDQGQNQNQAKANQPFFRIVDTNKWYIICELPSSPFFYKINDDVSIGFSEIPVKDTNAKIVKLVDGDTQGKLMVLELGNDIQNVINVRNTKVNISKKFEGLKVPKSAIIKYKGKEGVTKLKNGEKKFIEIKIVAYDDKYAIIEHNDQYEKLNVNDQIQLR
ncbi:MAG: HlyD family secretion protein [Xylanivirga thermophila]|jgi:putative membrane fusion protein|uniref:HlyD family efflux transporter periplasmic adaptor subunit n=1 Tax=Xylanivirga thermophila TaxID=2496273 RepID=UPI0039F63FD3